MKRQWSTPRRTDLEGSERSMELATALAQIADPDFLEKVIQAKALLDSVGGQFYIAAYRTKYDIVSGEPVEDLKQPGRYETDGYLIDYGHIARINRQDAEPDAKGALPNPVEEVRQALEEIEAEESEPAEDIEAVAS